MTEDGPVRHARVGHVMGTAVSIHVLTDGPLPDPAGAAVEACFDRLRDAEQIFSPWIPGSDVSRLRDGRLRLHDAHPALRDVRAACEQAEVDTGGLFCAWRDGWFDPTGYVKGWATERAARDVLQPLLDMPGVVAVGVNAGGDLQLATAPGHDWQWHVGIADPLTAGALIATVDVRDGGVATSGTAERGPHIIDPRTGLPATAVASATVVADSLTTADLWATTIIAAGGDHAAAARRAPARSVLTVDHRGRVRRWAHGVEIAVFTDPPLSPATPAALTKR